VADVNANIDVNVNTSNALAQLKSLQRQLSLFHTAVAKSSTAAASAQSDLQKNLINSINATGSFTAELRTVKTTSEAFTNSLEKNKFSMREYFRYAGASTKTFGKLFKSEFDTIGKVAEDRVKKLQTQYIKLGRDTSGAMKAIAVMPNELDLKNHSTQLQLAAQKQAIFNQLLKQGSTNLLNFGKNTQWAGRQLMVGFTLPLATLGMTASKTFMEMETAAIKFKKVYGDLLTPKAETQKALDNIQELAKQFTKYGIAVSQTVGLAAEAAAAGFQGLDLQRQTTEATRLSVLGQIDAQQALETTIALQNAFKMSSEELAGSIDFLNAVENQTVTSLDDITTAIPKVAPVIQQLGGDVKDLAFFLTAMKQGGINASEGANALKSGLAALINPSTKATAMLGSMGVNINKIVESNKGDIKSTVIDFALALDKLDPLNRARAIEQLFGKFQFARLSTLFSNVISEGTQASRVLDLAGTSLEDLASLSESELGMTADSAMNKFKKSVEDLKLALVPVGKAFLEAATPIVEFFGGILEKFGNLSDGAKKVITTLTVVIGGIGPIALMAFGLLANGIANVVKLFATLRNGYLRLTGQSAVLGEQTNYMTNEQLEAAAAAHSLNQTHANLTQTFTAEVGAVRSLIGAYTDAAAAASRFAMANPGMMIPGRGPAPKKYAKGKPYVVGGSGNKDSEPAMLAPGETVIPSEMSDKYGGLINGIISDSIPGYIRGRKTIAERTKDVPVYGDLSVFIQNSAENRSQTASVPGLANILAPLIARIGESRGLGFGQAAQAQYPSIIDAYTPIVQKFIAALEAEMARTESTISDSAERLARAWQVAGLAVETDLQAIPNEVERGTVRQALGVEEDSYGSIATNFRSGRGWGGRGSRYEEGTKPTSYMSRKFRKGTSAAYKLLTGSPVDAATQDYGHVFDVKTRESLGLPTTVPLSSLRSGEAPIAGSALSSINNSIAKAEKDAESYQKTIEAKTEDIYPASRDRNSPHPQVEKDASDDANKYEDVRERVTSKRRASYRPQGAPGDPVVPVAPTQSSVRGSRGVATVGPVTPGVPVQTIAIPLAQSVDQIQKVSDASEDLADDMQNQSKLTQSSADRLNRLNNSMMGASFAVASLSGITSMAGGKIGSLSGVISKVTTAMFALQAITTALTQTNALALLQKRAEIAGMLVGNVASKKMMFNTSLFAGGIKKLLPNLFNFGRVIIRFLGPVGLAVTAVSLLYVGINKYKAAQEKARLAVEGLGEAANISGNKLKNLDEYFGITPTKSPFETAGTNNPTTPAKATAVQQLRENETFQKDFKNDIEALRSASEQEAGVVLNAMAMKLAGRGYSKDQIDTILRALQQEAGKTDLELEFKNLDLKTKGGKAGFKKNVKETIDLLTDAFNDGIVKKKKLSMVPVGDTGLFKTVETTVNAFSSALKKNISTVSQSITAMITGLSGQLANGQISAEEFAGSFAEISTAIQSMPEPQALYLMDVLMRSLPENLRNTARGLNDTKYQLMLLEAQALGMANLPGLIEAMDIAANGFGPDQAAAKIRIENYRKDMDKRTKILEEFAKVNKDVVAGGATDGLSAESKKYIELLEKEIKSLEKKRDAQEAVNKELQRQLDLQMKQQDLTNKMKQAQISGDYLGAALLGQEQRKNVLDFNQETAAIKLDALLTKLNDRLAEIKDGASLTKAEKTKIKTKAATGGYIQGFEPGGKVSGPGTATSDSIPAMLSDGEYVIKSAAVSQYGVPLLHAINSQKFAGGGMVQKFKDGSKDKVKKGNFWSRFNPANMFSSYLEGMMGFGSSKSFNKSTTYKSSTTQQEKDYIALLTGQMLSGYTSAFNLKNNTSPEIFGSKGLGVTADVLGVLPAIGAAGKLALGAKKALVPNKVAYAAMEAGPKPLWMQSNSMMKSVIDSMYKRKDVKIDDLTYPTYSMGAGKNKVAFQGFEEDLSKLAQTGVEVIPATPQGLLQAALKMNPKNTSNQTMLDNFMSNNIGKPELDFLDNMSASIGINKKGGLNTSGEQTDGFAMLLSSLAGNKNAQSLISYKTKQFLAANKYLQQDYKGNTGGVHEPMLGPENIKNVPVIHSTKFDIVKDKFGNIVLNTLGDHSTGSSSPWSRPSLHTTLEAPVERTSFHTGGEEWSNMNKQIITDLQSMVEANGLPRSLNPADTWWLRNPGQALVMKNARVVMPYNNEKTYVAELVKRGLLKDGDWAPPVVSDLKNKEVLKFVKESYSEQDRAWLADNYPPADQLRRSNELFGNEQKMIDELGVQLAKKQLGIESSLPKLGDNWLEGGAGLRQEKIDRISKTLRVPQLVHNGKPEEIFESGFIGQKNNFPNTIFPGFVPKRVDNGPIELIRMLAKNGQFKTNIRGLLDNDDFDFLGTSAATGGYLKKGKLQVPKFHDWNGPVPGTYGQELPAILKSGTEGVYQEGYINDLKNAASNTTNSASSVYNVNMSISSPSADPKEVATEVMRRLQVATNKNNKTNVGLK
jgi:TP901 family phage tail tape measure protein